MKKVRMNLEGQNGNAFHLLGVFAAQARLQGWSETAIEMVRDEAMAGDYSHLLDTLGQYIEPQEFSRATLNHEDALGCAKSMEADGWNERD